MLIRAIKLVRQWQVGIREREAMAKKYTPLQGSIDLLQKILDRIEKPERLMGSPLQFQGDISPGQRLAKDFERIVGADFQDNFFSLQRQIEEIESFAGPSLQRQIEEIESFAGPSPQDGISKAMARLGYTYPLPTYLPKRQKRPTRPPESPVTPSEPERPASEPPTVAVPESRIVTPDSEPPTVVVPESRIVTPKELEMDAILTLLKGNSSSHELRQMLVELFMKLKKNVPLDEKERGKLRLAIGYHYARSKKDYAHKVDYSTRHLRRFRAEMKEKGHTFIFSDR